MKRKSAAALAMLTMVLATIGNSTAQTLADCDDLRRGAMDAQAHYVQIHTPRVDPVKTFDDATASCLEGIAMFDIGFSFTIPSLGDIDAFLRNMAMKLLQRACQAATAQFNRAVHDAVQSVNAPLAQIAGNVPGVSGGISTGSGSAGVTIRDDGGSTARNAIGNATERVVNFLR